MTETKPGKSTAGSGGAPDKAAEREAARARANVLLEQDTIEVRVERLVEGGLGFGRIEGFLLLIPRAAPGDLLRVRLSDRKRDYARAEIVEVLEPGPDRVQPPCSVYERCGGCDLQHIAADRQVQLKVSAAVETLRRLGGIEVRAPRIVSGTPFGYRSRAQLQVRGAGDDLDVGFFERGTNQLVPTLSCPVLVPGLERRLGPILQALRAESSQFLGVSIVVEDSEQSENLDAKSDATSESAEAEEAGEDQLSSGEAPESSPSTSSPVEGLAAGEADLAGADRPQGSGVPSRIDLFLGDEDDLTTAPATESLPHRPVIRRVGEFDYELDARCFFQGHDSLVEQLVETTVGNDQGEVVFELHAGVGLFTLPLARRFGRVFAVESDRIAARYLRKNAKTNDVENLEISPTTAEHFLRDWQSATQSAEATGSTGPPRADRWLVDPPRTGLSKDLVHAACRYRPRRITYVSCQPPTLARDLAMLHRFYAVEEVTFLDLFPQTAHLETVVQLRARPEPLPGPPVEDKPPIRATRTGAKPTGGRDGDRRPLSGSSDQRRGGRPELRRSDRGGRGPGRSDAPSRGPRKYGDSGGREDRPRREDWAKKPRSPGRDDRVRGERGEGRGTGSPSWSGRPDPERTGPGNSAQKGGPWDKQSAPKGGPWDKRGDRSSKPFKQRPAPRISPSDPRSPSEGSRSEQSTPRARPEPPSKAPSRGGDERANPWPKPSRVEGEVPTKSGSKQGSTSPEKGTRKEKPPKSAEASPPPSPSPPPPETKPNPWATARIPEKKKPRD